jgi:1,4-dihydroxy-2-naphthoate octaprenyltransferase
MSTLGAWIKAARPRTLPLSLSGIIVGLGLTVEHGNTAPIAVIGCLLTTIFFQVLSNFANDLGDGMKGTDNAQRIGPTRAVQSGEISIQQMKIAVIVLGILSVLSAATLIYAAPAINSSTGIIFYTILAMLCVVAAITYTVGKKAYGYHGLGDLMVFLFFGIVAVSGTKHLFEETFSINELFGALAIGAWSTMVLNLNNMRDIANDAASGKRTLVVLLGSKNAKRYHYLLAFLGCSAWIILLYQQAIATENYLILMAGLPVLLFAKHLTKVIAIKEPKAFDPELKKVALSTFFASILYYALSYL